MVHMLASVFATLLSVSVTSALTDNRCFLETGSSSETFFVSESLPVGSTLGELRIHGDPRPGGSIILRLKELDSPVEIAPGTKNLTLKKPLDKEGVEGPSNVFLNLICERVGTLDPGFIIPINIRVTDSNDNSPTFINAPYTLNISEVTVVGTRVLQGVHAIDNDQQGPYSIVRYSILPGPNSEFFDFENELEGTLVLKKPLDYESLKSFDVRIRAQDHGEPPRKSDTILTVNIIDADDQNPRFMDDRYTAVIPSPATRGAVLTIKPRDIKAFDQDIGINAPIFYTFNEIGSDYSLFKLNRLTAKISLNKNLDEKDLPHPAILVIRATQQDNPDRYALATLTVSRTDINSGIQFLHDTFHIRASEALPVGALIGTLSNNRPGQQLRYFVSDQSVLRVFNLNTKGELTLRKKLDYEEKPEYHFKVFATDGITNDSSVINVTVVDVNEWEPRFRYPQYEFFVVGQMNELIGKIEAADGDGSDNRLTLTLSGQNASLFFITPDGELRLRDRGVAAHKGTAYLTVTAIDNGNPPKKATVPVTVHFPGAGALGISSIKGNDSAPLLLAGLGAVLLVLVFIVALLIAYICKVKKTSRQSSGESALQPRTEKQIGVTKKITPNPVFAGGPPSTVVSTIGGLPKDKSKIPSPKVHPAPLPPVWPHPGSSTRVKKLSWGDDKTDSDSAENLAEGAAPRILDNSNLTVYF